MNLQPVWEALEASPVGDFVASSSWAFPTIECIHVIAIVTVVGTVMIMDLRLLGLASKSCAVTEISSDTLPWTWGAFVLAAISGSLLFVSKAHIYMIDPWFLWKMGLIVVAGVNMGIFHFFTWKSVHAWNSDCAVPLAGKIAGGLSLFFWVLVVFCARLIGFTLGIYE
jgi:hypothetical protein